jgi:hypothetical protein
MKKLLWLVLVLLQVSALTAQTAPRANAIEAVNAGQSSTLDMLNTLKGEWRYMYKIVGNDIMYEYGVRQGKQSGTIEQFLDTLGIHRFLLDDKGVATYRLNWEDAGGTLVENQWDPKGRWDVKYNKTTDKFDVRIYNAYYKNSGTVVRRIERVNPRQLILVDAETNTTFYYERRGSK